LLRRLLPPLPFFVLMFFALYLLSPLLPPSALSFRRLSPAFSHFDADCRYATPHMLLMPLHTPPDIAITPLIRHDAIHVDDDVCCITPLLLPLFITPLCHTLLMRAVAAYCHFR